MPSQGTNAESEHGVEVELRRLTVPFRFVSADEFRTAAVNALVQRACDGEPVLPILADALEDAGYEGVGLLTALRCGQRWAFYWLFGGDQAERDWWLAVDISDVLTDNLNRISQRLAAPPEMVR